MAGVKGKGGKKGIGRKPRPVPEGTRWCGGCKAALPLADFSGVQRTCKECKRFRHLKRAYSLGREQYAAMMEAQKGVCAICQVRDCCYVDHDHRTGMVRGLLCQPCNTALGAFYDDPVVFERAVRYAGIARNE